MTHQAVLNSSQQLQEQQQQALEKLRTQLATADLKVRKAGLDVQSITQQLQKSQDELQVSPYQLVLLLAISSSCRASDICTGRESKVALFHQKFQKRMITSIGVTTGVSRPKGSPISFGDTQQSSCFVLCMQQDDLVRTQFLNYM